jgi:hypothetical protein
MNNIRIVLIAASVLGLLSDFLFHDTIFKSVPWGLNLFVWLLSVSVASLILTCRTKPTSQWKSLWFLVPPLFLAAGCAWRDSGVLRALDLLLIAFTLCACAMSTMGCRLVHAGVTQYLLTVAVAFQFLFSRPAELFFRDIEWQGMIDENLRTQVSAVLRGVAISLPILAVFCVLLCSADAAFASLFGKTFQLDLGHSATHLLLVFGSMWAAGGYLHAMFNCSLTNSAFDLTREESLKLGVVETSVVLGLIDLLFLSFVMVQAQYFFGGANLVEVTSGMTYAEYARRGFFELVAVASLVIPVLLLLDWLVDKASAAGVIIIRALSGVQIGLLFVIMLSAVQRMRLYQQEYGMTELRLYTTAFMAWLAIVCIIFLVTVMRGERKAFAFASVISGLCVMGGLHTVNPDAMIISTNIARAREGKAFDVDYALRLSNDAVPALIAGLPDLKREQQRAVSTKLRASFGRAWKADWRAWNWSGSRAYQAASEYLSRNTPSNSDKISYRRPATESVARQDGIGKGSHPVQKVLPGCAL